MKKALEIVIRKVDNPTDVEALINEEIAKLETLCDSIIKGRVLVEKAPKQLPSDNQFTVHIQLQVPPNYDIVVKKEPSKKDESDSVFHYIHEAFDAAERQIKKIKDLRHPKQKEKRLREAPEVEVEEEAEEVVE